MGIRTYRGFKDTYSSKYLFPTNEKVNIFNHENLKRMNLPVAKVTAVSGGLGRTEKQLLKFRRTTPVSCKTLSSCPSEHVSCRGKIFGQIKD
jgi:hypothetical protein